MMDVEGSSPVTVSCASYSQYVAIAFRNLFDSRRGADFDCKWDGNTVRAHRIILELFLATDTMGCQHDPLGIKQEVPDGGCAGASGNNVLESLLEFLYKGEVKVPVIQLEKLLRASKELDFKILEDAVVQLCHSKLVEMENVLCIKEEKLFSSSKGLRLMTVSCDKHSQYVAIALRNLFDSRRGTDFDLNWDGKTIRGHRIILELFLATETMGTNVDLRHDSLVIKQEVPDDDIDGSNNVLDPLLQFLYKGEVTVPEEQLEELLRASKELGFKMLEDAIVQFYNFKVVQVESLIGIKEESATNCPEEQFKDLHGASEELGFNMLVDAVVESKVEEVENALDIEEENGSSCSEEGGINISNQDESHAAADDSDNLKIASPKVVKLHKCHLCKFETMVLRKYQRHLLGIHEINAKGNPVPMKKCPHCEFETSSSGSYRLHLVKAHEINTKGEPASKHKCPHCDFGTTVYLAYYRHLTFFHGLTVKGDPLPIFQCAHCKFNTTLKASFTYHNKSAHGKTIHGEPTPSHKCPHCDFEVPVHKKYCNHLLVAHGVTVTGSPAPVFNCAHCEFETPSKSKYRHHNLSAHGKTTQGEPVPKHKCPECDFSTTNIGALKSHCKCAHIKERSFACELCTYVGKRKEHLVQHSNSAHGVGDSRFTCGICRRRCISGPEMERHMQVHTDKSAC